MDRRNISSYYPTSFDKTLMLSPHRNGQSFQPLVTQLLIIIEIIDAVIDKISFNQVYISQSSLFMLFSNSSLSQRERGKKEIYQKYFQLRQTLSVTVKFVSSAKQCVLEIT